MPDNNPSETAGFLAAVVAALDRHARENFTSDDLLYRSAVAQCVRAFFDAFRSAQVRLIPRLAEFKRTSPVRYAGVSGTSYHEIICRIALAQYREMLLRLNYTSVLQQRETRLSEFQRFSGQETNPEEVIAHWDDVREWLARQFADVEPIEAEFLIAGIETEQPPRSPPQKQFRVSVCQQQFIVTIDGESFPLKGPKARIRLAAFIQALIDADGSPVSAAEFEVRSRDVENQCDEIRDLIGAEASPGKGYAIPRAKLRLS